MLTLKDMIMKVEEEEEEEEEEGGEEGEGKELALAVKLAAQPLALVPAGTTSQHRTRTHFCAAM